MKSLPVLRIFPGPIIVSLVGVIAAGCTASIHTTFGMDLRVLYFFNAVAVLYLVINLMLWVVRRRKRGS